MPVPFAPAFQILFVLLLPIFAAVTPSTGAMRTVSLRAVRLPQVINAVVAVDGRIVATRPDGELVVTGRRDRIVGALLPLGVLALPARAAGCSAETEG